MNEKEWGRFFLTVALSIMFLALAFCGAVIAVALKALGIV